MTRTESLEVEIERVWVELPIVPVGLYLTPMGRIVRRSSSAQAPQAWKYIGTYTRAISLAGLREDVFDAFEQGARHG